MLLKWGVVMNETEAILTLRRSRIGQVNEEDFEKSFELAIKALEEIQQYRALEKRLEEMFGGQLPLSEYVDRLEEALSESDKPNTVNARILTYEDADKWERYKALGTVEECETAIEKYKTNKSSDEKR